MLFRCAWFQVVKDDYGFTCIDFNKLCYLDDPFVMASQVRQVFYMEDPIEVGLHYVMKRVPRDLYGLEEENCPNIEQVFWSELDDYAHNISESHNVVESINWARDDEAVETMDIPSHLLEVQEDEEAEEDSNIDDTDWDWMDINE